MWIMAKTWAEKLAELAVLKERVRALEEAVAEYKKFEGEWIEMVARERARSDNAVDRMLGNQGIPPITPIKSASIEELSSMFEEDAEEVNSIRLAIKEHGAANVLLGAE